MTQQDRRPAVDPTPGASVPARPLDASAVRFTTGFWADWLRTNHETSLFHGAEQIERAGNLANFEALRTGGSYRAGRDDSGALFPFLDSDVYKWLEAAGWQLGRAPDPQLAKRAHEMIEVVSRAQRADGYLNTYVQLGGGPEFADLQWAHELYSAGHLIQAAVAWQRALGDGRLLTVARRLADRIDLEFGPRGRVGTDGHPEIEMALVELYRVTGESRYLRLAQRVLDARGHRLLGAGRFGDRYWQDHAPVRSAPTPTGHAVRQLYLDCGAVDVAVETGDTELLDAVIRRWEDMVATRMYVTGGIGSHHRDESFGERYELPPDRAYAETCAAIASVMLSWRLLLATGESRFADIAERTMFNAVLPGVGLGGTEFFYVNPLQRRTEHEDSGPGAESTGRASWFACACCPPNVMRTLPAFEQQIATTSDDGIQLQQYCGAELTAHLRPGRVTLGIETGYPWHGDVRITIGEAPSESWVLSLRTPSWTSEPAVEINGVPEQPVEADGYIQLARSWSRGDQVLVTFNVEPRLTRPDPRIDAVRGCVAVERGPVVYCLEQTDLASGVRLEDIVLAAATEPQPATAPGLPTSIPALSVAATARREETSPWPYKTLTRNEHHTAYWVGEQLLVPYFAWANRGSGAMRVWLPVDGN